MKTRTENWRGHSIRFVEIDNAWWAVLKDICDALNLSTWHVAQRLEPNMLEKVSIDTSDLGSNEVRSRGDNKTRSMLVVNEIGIYEALFASRRLEARKFRIWAGSVLQRLRQNIGLKQYEIMRMTDPDIQDQINYMLDDIFYDPESDQLMCSARSKAEMSTCGHLMKYTKNRSKIMALTTEEVDDLMHCNCDAEVKALDFDITANRIKAILICTGCGKMVSVSGDIDMVSDVRYAETVRLVQDESEDCE